MNWAYGITTVPARMHEVLLDTIKSLAKAGFDKPRLFIDGLSNPEEYDNKFCLELTLRSPAVRVMGNWGLALAELYVRNPTAARYAIFQDDLVTYANLRKYLESCKYPDKGYWNLYTFPVNQARMEKGRLGWFRSNQRGLGAVALVFNRDAVLTLLNSRYLYDRITDQVTGWKSIDGGIVTAFKNAGWSEYVHNPSLVQHVGHKSTIGNRPHPQATTFKGEQYDAANLIGRGTG